MKGSYGMTLVIILLVTNFVLYLYGVPLAHNWLNVGFQAKTEESETIPTGNLTVGGFSSRESIVAMIGQLIFVVAAIGGLGILANLFTGGRTNLNFIIPLAMVGGLLVFFATPMGNIIGSTAVGENWINGEFCYAPSGVRIFGNVSSSLCLPTELHMLLLIVLGSLMLGTFMSFTRGYEW